MIMAFYDYVRFISDIRIVGTATDSSSSSSRSRGSSRGGVSSSSRVALSLCQHLSSNKASLNVCPFS